DVRSQLTAAGGQASSKTVRNPFELPPDWINNKQKEEGKGQVIDPTKVAELKRKIAAIFDRIAKLAKENKVDELIPAFNDLKQLMTEFGSLGAEEAQKYLAECEKKLGEYKEIYLAVQLQ